MALVGERIVLGTSDRVLHKHPALGPTGTPVSKAGSRVLPMLKP